MLRRGEGGGGREKGGCRREEKREGGGKRGEEGGGLRRGRGGEGGVRKGERMQKRRKRSCLRTRRLNEFFFSSLPCTFFILIVNKHHVLVFKNGNQLTASQIALPFWGMERPGWGWCVALAFCYTES